jgi:hypothetical protein
VRRGQRDRLAHPLLGGVGAGLRLLDQRLGLGDPTALLWCSAASRVSRSFSTASVRCVSCTSRSAVASSCSASRRAEVRIALVSCSAASRRWEASRSAEASRSSASARASVRIRSTSLIAEVRASSSSLSWTIRMSSASRAAWVLSVEAWAVAARMISSARVRADDSTSSACSSARRSSSLAFPPSPA